jgi:hypothetical protein
MQPEKASELLTLIFLLHNCHRTNHEEIIFRFDDIVTSPRDHENLPTGLHFVPEIILLPQKQKIRSILPTVNNPRLRFFGEMVQKQQILLIC